LPVMMLMAAPSHKQVHTSSAFHTPMKSRPLMLIDPHTLPRVEPIMRSHLSSTPGLPHARSAKCRARTAHLHEIKVSCEQCSSGAKWSGAYKERENDHQCLSEDMFSVLLSSPFQTKAKCRSHDDFCGPCTPLHSHEESVGADADVWIDTDVDTDDDISVVSNRVVVLNSPGHDVFG